MSDHDGQELNSLWRGAKKQRPRRAVYS
jgi:hypothetical protein